MNPDQLTEQLGLFLDVLETGSFSAASPPSSTDPFGRGAAHRQPGKRRRQPVVYSRVPTPSARPGRRGVCRRARRIMAELQLARAEAVSLSSAPEGLIRIDAPTAFGRRHLAPVIADFLMLYPGLDVQLHLIDSFVDMQG